MSDVGNDILALVEGAKRDVLIVAPFIKSAPISRLLDSASSAASKTIVTRWRCADVLAGVSDLDVFDIAARHDVKFLLCSNLHAKLYAADDSCLVGSANVTDTALGWRSPTNVELMVPVSRTDPHVAAFEEALLRRSKEASMQQHDLLLELVRRMDDAGGKIGFQDGEPSVVVLPASWVPRARNPEDLYRAYSGEEDTSFGLFKVNKEEVAELGVVDGLSRPAFYAWVGEAISQTPLVRGVTEMISSEGQVTEEGLGRILGQNGLGEVVVNVRDLLEVLERWLNEFLPERYETTRDSIKLISR